MTKTEALIHQHTFGVNPYQDQLIEEVRAQHERISELEEMLRKECQHSADQKLRAEQMSQQHSTQAALNSEARKELAEIKAQQCLHQIAEPAATHPDDAAVDNLAAAMKSKLAKQRAKGYGGWDKDCTQEHLSDLLRAHVNKRDPVDVANFCAFLLTRGEGIATTQPAALVLDAEAIERATKKMAALFDYPWEHMPEQGREQMRQHTRAVIAAAKAKQGDA